MGTDTSATGFVWDEPSSKMTFRDFVRTIQILFKCNMQQNDGRSLFIRRLHAGFEFWLVALLQILLMIYSPWPVKCQRLLEPLCIGFYLGLWILLSMLPLTIRFDIYYLKNREKRFSWPLREYNWCPWRSENCVVALQPKYQGKEKEPADNLEAIAGHNVWIWHACFGRPCSMKDSQVLEASSRVNVIASRRYSLPLEYNLGGS